MDFSVLKWPPEDLYPKEHICNVVERKIRILDLQPTNLEELWDAIIITWTQILKEFF